MIVSPLFGLFGPQAAKNRIMARRYLNQGNKKGSFEESCPIPV
jgi:hypothetical protein